MAAIAVAAMVATSCSSDDDNGGGEGGGPETPKVYVGLNAIYDKSTGSGYIKSSWSTGDNFSVYAGAQKNLKFDAANVATSPTASGSSAVTTTALDPADNVDNVIVNEGSNKIYVMSLYKADAGEDPTALAVPASDVQHFPVSGQRGGDLAYTFATGYAEYASSDYVADQKWDVTVKPYYTNCSWPISFDAGGVITAIKLTADKPITMSATGKVNAETRDLSGTSTTLNFEMPEGGFEVVMEEWGASKTVHFVILKQAALDGVKLTMEITYGGTQYTINDIEIADSYGLGNYQPKNSITVNTTN